MGLVINNICCEYISTILHTAVSLLDGLIISSQLTIIGTESSGRVDYAIKRTLDASLRGSKINLAPDAMSELVCEVSCV